MKKLILIFLLFCSVALGAESVVTLWGGDALSTVSSFPGVFTKALYDTKAATGDVSDLYGTNGTYISFDNTDSSAVSFLGGNAWSVAIADTTGILEDMYCRIESIGTNDSGYYLITGVVADTHIIVLDTALDGIATLTNNENNSYFIGGIMEVGSTGDLQNAFDTIGPDCGATSVNAINNLDILCHLVAAITIDDTIDIDAISGSTTTRVRVIGNNSDFEDDGTQIEINTEDTLANGLFDMDPAGQYLTFRNIDFDGGNATDDAAYCIFASSDGDADYSTFENCKMHGASLDGMAVRSLALTIVNCDIYGNKENGIDQLVAENNVNILNNRIYDNIIAGIRLRINHGNVSGNQIYGNATGIIEVNSTGTMTYSNNTIYGQSADGIVFHASSTRTRVFNNTFSSNVGNAIDFNGRVEGSFLLWSNNHSDDNGANSDTGLTDAQWLIFGDGSNIVGDPLFVNTGADDFTPTSASPLVGAGVGSTGDVIGALCATAGGGGRVVGVSWN